MVQLDSSLVFEKFDSDRHSELVKGFDCGHKDSNEFIRDSLYTYSKENIGCTYLLLKDKALLGFVTIAAGAIKFRDPELALSMDSSEKPSQLPALKIGRIGTAIQHQNKGYGELMLKSVVKIFDILTEYIAIRYVTVDAVPEKVAWYEKRGFKSLYTDPTGHPTIPMYLMPGKITR